MTDDKPKESTSIVVRAARAPLAPALLSGEVVELEDAFDDASLEMNAAGEKFRVATALQSTIATAAEDADDALALAATANSAAGAAQSTANAANSAASAAQSTANNALASAGAASASPPYVGLVRAPASPSAWSDEFESGSADLVERGWTLRPNGSDVVPVRVGPFDPNAAALTVGQYRSSIVGSKLLLQIPSGTFISKPLAASCALAARVGAFGIATGSPWGVGVTNTPKHSDPASRFLFGWNQGDQAKLLQYIAGTYTNQGAVASISLLQAYDTQWFTFTLAGTTLTAAQVRHISGYSGQIASLASTFAGSMTGFTPVYGGLVLSPSAGCWFEIDYIRQYPAGAFFPS